MTRFNLIKISILLLLVGLFVHNSALVSAKALEIDNGGLYSATLGADAKELDFPPPAQGTVMHWTNVFDMPNGVSVGIALAPGTQVFFYPNYEYDNWNYVSWHKGLTKGFGWIPKSAFQINVGGNCPGDSYQHDGVCYPKPWTGEPQYGCFPTADGGGICIDPPPPSNSTEHVISRWTNLYNAPGGSPTGNALGPGIEVEIISRSSDENWVQVSSENSAGWVPANAVSMGS